MDVVFFIAELAVGRTLPTGLATPTGLLEAAVGALVGLLTEPVLATEVEELVFLSVETGL